MSQDMDHLEVRAIRGSLSRAAFARLLGVTSLTVLRWELPPDNKEARRPRAKMVEALRRVAAAGVASPAAAVDAEEEEDADASEPIAGVSSTELEQGEAMLADELLLGPLLRRIVGEQWQAGADELLGVAASGALRTAHGKALATLGLAQVQLLGRMDVRGALTTLLPVLAQAELGALSRQASARAHVLAALLFAAPDCRVYDLGRINAHSARAEALLEPHEDDARVLLVAARVAGARSLGPERVRAAFEAGLGALERAAAPVTRALASGLLAKRAGLGAQADPVGEPGEGLEQVEALGLWPLSLALLADRAWRTLRGSSIPDDVIKVTRHARERARAESVPAVEALLRILACEIEALTRAGRFEEANALVVEAEQLAKRGGLLRHALAMPVARLMVYTNRVEGLDAWADKLETDAVGSQRGAAAIHVAMVRGLSAGLRGELAKAEELLHQVCAAPETTPGIDFVAHDAHFELVVVKLLLGEREAARTWLRRAHAHNQAFPSVWHAALFQRAESLVLLAAGQHAEARSKVEAVRTTCELLGDVVQCAFAKAGLAMVARASGAPDAEHKLREVLAELSQLGVWSPELLRRSQALSVPALRQEWRAEALTERLVGAVEKLGVRGLSGEQYRRGLAVTLGELFPGREVFVGGAAPEGEVTTSEVGVGDSTVRFGLKGKSTPEEQAALHILRFFLPRALASSVAQEPQLPLDAVLPHFIAVSPAMRRLKSEIAGLARSNATILIGGESGTGKEVVARALHDLSARARGPYIVFNCASVPRDLFESQLFGHRKGAFTGALNDSLGVIRAADGGTLFLDEIGELPLDTQPKLLRFLENAEILPVGEQRARRVDVRVLAATHRNLEELVRNGRFREDLYYRLNVVPLSVPPLRERPEDVVALARLFMRRLAPEGDQAPELGMDAVHALKAHSWPGNVRELRNVMERAMAYAPLPTVLHADQLRIQL